MPRFSERSGGHARIRRNPEVATDWPRTLRGTHRASSPPIRSKSSEGTAVSLRALQDFDARCRLEMDRVLVTARDIGAEMRTSLYRSMVLKETAGGGTGHVSDLNIEQHLDLFDRMCEKSTHLISQSLKQEHLRLRHQLRANLMFRSQIEVPKVYGNLTLTTTSSSARLRQHQRTTSYDDYEEEVEKELSALYEDRRETPATATCPHRHPRHHHQSNPPPPNRRTPERRVVLRDVEGWREVDDNRENEDPRLTTETALEAMLESMFEQQRSILKLLGPLAEKISQSTAG
eukprot:PhF_6_TR22679/c0_g1_i1/m.32293